MLALESFDECEQVIKKQLRRDPENVQLYVTYGKLFERQVLDEQAEEQYRLAIEKMPKDQFAITRLANAFMVLTKYDLAIETYERGSELLKDKEAFAYNLGELYRRKGDSAKMIESYLNSIETNPGRTNSVKAIFQRYLLPEDYQELQTQLYTLIQEKPDAVFYPEMLTWVFIQQKDYRNAFRQARALDRRLRENGGRVYRIGEIAANDKAYEAAIMAYDYIVAEKGPSSSFYIDAKRESLRCKRRQLVEGYDYSPEELKQLEKEYESFLDEFGRSKLTANIVLELAELEAIMTEYAEPAASAEEERRQHVASLRFHARLSDFGQNKLLGYFISFMAQILTDLTVYKRLYTAPNHDLWQKGRRHQADLIAALRRGDAEAARDTMRSHMLMARKLMEDQEAEVMKRFIAE